MGVGVGRSSAFHLVYDLFKSGESQPQVEDVPGRFQTLWVFPGALKTEMNSELPYCIMCLRAGEPREAWTGNPSQQTAPS